jgi:hypothetical protein
MLRSEVELPTQSRISTHVPHERQITWHFSTIDSASWWTLELFERAFPKWMLATDEREAGKKNQGAETAHLLALLSLAVHGIAFVAEDQRFHLVVHHDSALGGMNIDAPSLHFAAICECHAQHHAPPAAKAQYVRSPHRFR